MIEFLCLYIGFTLGFCLMDYVGVREHYYLHLYRTSPFNIFISLLMAPISFPFYLIIYLQNKFKK